MFQIRPAVLEMILPTFSNYVEARLREDKPMAIFSKIFNELNKIQYEH